MALIHNSFKDVEPIVLKIFWNSTSTEISKIATVNWLISIFYVIGVHCECELADRKRLRRVIIIHVQVDYSVSDGVSDLLSSLPVDGTDNFIDSARIN